MKYKSRSEIIASILEVTGSRRYGVTKTEIMYHVFIPYTVMQEYLTFMFEKGVIEIKEAKEAKKRQKRFFVSTDKGRRLLNLYEQINEMISITAKKKNNAV